MADRIVLDCDGLAGVNGVYRRPSRLLDARHSSEGVVSVLDRLAVTVGELRNAAGSVHDEANSWILRIISESLVDSPRLVYAEYRLVAERIADRGQSAPRVI